MTYPHLTERERTELDAFHDSCRLNWDLMRQVEQAADEATRLPRRWWLYALAIAVVMVAASAVAPMAWWG